VIAVTGTKSLRMQSRPRAVLFRTSEYLVFTDMQAQFMALDTIATSTLQVMNNVENLP